MAIRINLLLLLAALGVPSQLDSKVESNNLLAVSARLNQAPPSFSRPKHA